ncbi:hypothetical protein Btru_060506 [Bulinus truncatus]|nr:hypothetical protein Btru_060506 [Bulinus truncatus]
MKSTHVKLHGEVILPLETHFKTGDMRKLHIRWQVSLRVTLPTQPCDLSIQTCDLPTQPCDLPIQPCDLPTQPCDLPTQPCDLLIQPCDLPTQPCDLLIQPCDLPTQPCDLSIQTCDLPTQPCDLPIQPCDLPTQPCDLPIHYHTVLAYLVAWDQLMEDPYLDRYSNSHVRLPAPHTDWHKQRGGLSGT